jgi:hypothetical protein
VKARARAIVEEAITEDGNQSLKTRKKSRLLDVSCDPALTRVKAWVVTGLRFGVSQGLI